MNWLISLEQIADVHLPDVGGKGLALARMAAAGMNVPPALVLRAGAYREYVSVTGLRERILLELNRKSFEDMRWEEMWDAALRIRSMFLSTPIPDGMYEEISRGVAQAFPSVPTAVRSSALAEDAGGTSFAGLHESYVNVRGADSILEHIRLVWASLWSDGALLYRKELGLDVADSAMAVVIQEIVSGRASGVCFSRDPEDAGRAIVEAVHGLNQGLVDGTVEPDRWFLDRASRRVLSHHQPKRESAMRPSERGVELVPLSAGEAASPPVDERELALVLDQALRAEALFGGPQDVEWTVRGNALHLLQSRPITTGESADESKAWHLSLRRSFDNLKVLRQRVEGELIPALIEEGRTLAQIDLTGLDDASLAREIQRRESLARHWTDTYWEHFIPYAHGARLFGQVYNDAVRPEDPFEFIALLQTGDMESVKRNALLEQIADSIRQDPAIAKMIEQGAELPRPVQRMMSELAQLVSPTETHAGADTTRIARLALQASRVQPDRQGPGTPSRETLESRFLGSLPEDQRPWALELLDLARSSYRLRDDDNVYLGRVEAQVAAAIAEGRRRLAGRATRSADALSDADVASALLDPGFVPQAASASAPAPRVAVKPRQLTGQPAGPGVSTGPARVIRAHEDLFTVEAGDVLVCDAIDPNMTFVVPVCCAVVERRGGMLIHGAIIAREYGLPCVTGVPDATELIQTGDILTVDGFLGIVVVRRAD